MKQPKSKAKVLIIFPRYNKDDATHYPYWYKLFNAAGEHLEISLLFESGQGRSSDFSQARSVTFQKFHSKPLNLVERFLLIRKHIFEGYSNIYIHYSYWSVLLAWVIKKTNPKASLAKIFYWDCEKYETKPRNTMLKLALYCADVLVTGHEVIGKSYREIFNFSKPIEIVPNWVEVDRRSTSQHTENDEKFEAEKLNLTPKTLHPKPINVLFVHHLSPRKGSRLLPEIIAQTVKMNSKIHFHIVGNGPDFLWLKDQLELLQISKYATLHGSLTHQQTATLYKSSDVFIMPSLSEGFPRVILEACAYGLPIISTDVGCVRQLLGKKQQEWIVGIEQFPQKILQLLSSDEIETIGQENKGRARQYILSKSLASFVSLFNHGR